MPTREDFDVVPLRKETKRQLARLRGEGTYDSAIRSLLDAQLPRAVSGRRALDATDQIGLADLAAKRWQLAVRRGQLVEVGPRLVVYRTGMRERRRLDVRPG